MSGCHTLYLYTISMSQNWRHKTTNNNTSLVNFHGANVSCQTTVYFQIRFCENNLSHSFHLPPQQRYTGRRYYKCTLAALQFECDTCRKNKIRDDTNYMEQFIIYFCSWWRYTLIQLNGLPFSSLVQHGCVWNENSTSGLAFFRHCLLLTGSNLKRDLQE